MRFNQDIDPLILVFGLAGWQAPAQYSVGHYEGAATRDESVQLVQADFDTSGGKLTGTFDILEDSIHAPGHSKRRP